MSGPGSMQALAVHGILAVMTGINCNVKPIPAADALTARRGARGILYLESAVLESWPLGLNLDSQIIFDMRADGRVMGIEFFARVGGSFVSERAARKIASNGFHGLYLSSVHDSLSADDIGFKLKHKDRHLIWWAFGEPERPTRYWLGGGGFAEVERGTLVGVGIQFQA